MRLSRIFVEHQFDIGSVIDLPADKGHYVKNVLRLKNSQNFVLFNGQETLDYLAEISFHGKKVSATIVSSLEKQNDSTLEITLVQAIGKSEHVDFIMQKATELGVNRFQLFNSSRTQSPLKGERLQKKLNHWKGISISACEQCNRNIIPEILFAQDLKACIENPSTDNRILLDFQGQPFSALSAELVARKNFSVLVGCEGGLTDAEIKLATESGFKSLVCGPRTLRMETAALAILSIVQHHFGDMN